MIVSCEHCHTRFKLDNKRIRPAGVKLRCSKCQHTFELKPLPPAGAALAREKSAAPSVAEAPPGEEVVLAPGSEGGQGGMPDPDEIERAVDAALRMPEGPAPGDLNQAEGGERSGRAEDLFGAPAVNEDGPPAGSSDEFAPPAGDVGKRSEDFDWDHVSFTESRPASVEDALKATEEAGAPAESETLELDIDRPTPSTGRDARPRGPQERFPKPEAGAGSDLELDRPAQAQARPPVRPGPVASMAFDRVSEGSGRSKAAEQDAPVRSGKPSVVYTSVGFSLNSPATVRPKRPPLALPLFPTLAAAIVLGLLVALASALTLYAPDGPLARTPAVVKPGGAPGSPAALRLDGLSGRRIGRDAAAPRYVVTGKAHWSAPPQGKWVLDGVLVDRSGRALQRRPARVGPLSALSRTLDGDPVSGARATPLPVKGESGFLILFDPQPSWKADVRFEVRRAE